MEICEKMSMNSDDMQRMSKVLRHRLRNIASGIGSAVNLIDEESGDSLPSGLREYFPLINRECQSLSIMAERFGLLWSPYTEETLPCDATLIVQEKILSLSEQFPNVEFRTRLQGEISVPGLLQSALHELMLNACEAAPRGVVGIIQQQEGGFLIWTVSDSGPGMPEKDRAQVFKPFFTSKPRHIGLGLPIARRIAEHYGGTCNPATACDTTPEWSVTLSYPLSQTGSQTEAMN